MPTVPQSLLSSQVDAIPLQGGMSKDRKQWIHLLRPGYNHPVDGRDPWRVDDMKAIVTRSFAAISTDKIPIDYEHGIDLASPKGQPAPAAGWMSRMEVRKDGIWGLVEWTRNASRMIEEREYRFLSPTIRHTPKNLVLSILRAALTNNPALTLTALNAAQKGNPMDMEEMLQQLRTLLGLADDANSEAIIEAVTKLSQSLNSADPSQFVPVAMFQQTLAELQRFKSGVSLQTAEREVNQAMQNGQLLPFMKDWAVSLCQANKAAFDDFLEGAGKPVGEFIETLATRQGHGANFARLEALNGKANHQTEIHRNLGLTAEDVKKYDGKVK